MQKWADNVKNIKEYERVRQVITAANNHYSGFGPGIANLFRNILGLPDAKWEDKEEQSAHELKQGRSSALFLILLFK